MPTKFGITGMSWDPVAEVLRVTYSGPRPASTFSKIAVPAATLSQGVQATEDWMNANLGSIMWGVDQPPPFIRVKVTSVTPFVFEYACSDFAIPAAYFDIVVHTPIPHGP